MDLYQPLYNPRPVVQPELYANLRPQTYGDAMDELKAMASPPARSDMKKERLLGKLAQGFASDRANAPAAVAAQEMEMGRLEEGVVSMAMAEDKGELFEYRIDQPVTLAKHTSALLPIIGQTLQGQKVSLYNQRVNAKHPLNGYRLKNTSSLHLMQGPITLFDSGAYAGDARIEDLAPGQDRLISYALDLKAEVEPKLEGGTQELATVSLKKGTMLISRRLVEDRTYLVTEPRRQGQDRADRATLSCRLETCRTERADRTDARHVSIQRLSRSREKRDAPRQGNIAHSGIDPLDGEWHRPDRPLPTSEGSEPTSERRVATRGAVTQCAGRYTRAKDTPGPTHRRDHGGACSNSREHAAAPAEFRSL